MQLRLTSPISRIVSLARTSRMCSWFPNCRVAPPHRRACLPLNSSTCSRRSSAFLRYRTWSSNSTWIKSSWESAGKISVNIAQERKTTRRGSSTRTDRYLLWYRSLTGIIRKGTFSLRPKRVVIRTLEATQHSEKSMSEVKNCPLHINTDLEQLTLATKRAAFRWLL